MSADFRPWWQKLLVIVLAFAAFLYLILPFAWLVLTSFMTQAEALSVPPHFYPQEPTLVNYLAFLNPKGSAAVAAAGGVTKMPQALWNSTVVAIWVTVINLSVGSLAAYSFARLRFAGSTALMLTYLAVRMVPGVAVMIPIYVLFKNMGLINTKTGLVLAEVAFSLPFTVWILKGYFQTIPRDLEDAARVDRCTWFQGLRHVFMPLAAPGLVSAGTVAFMGSWGSFLFPLLLGATDASRVATVVISEFATDIEVDYGLMMAAGVISVLPPLILALVFQRYIMQGLTSGSVKG
jgi:multiple sugar transport system permease protein